MDALVKKALEGDPRSIARLISLVESESSLAEKAMKQIYPHTGRARIIGVTGSPGAGKSTLVDKLIARFKAEGKSVGIIAVDPSSPFTGGAILGDRLRMQSHATDPSVFIRSMGTRGALGGVSRATHETALILDACGKDVVLIETVGVGQSEIDIVRLADTVCLILVPGMGDDVQNMKAGIMEIADVFIVNKADRDGADKVAADVRILLDLAPPRPWRAPVVKTAAEADQGIEEAAEAIRAHGAHLSRTDEGRLRRLARLESEMEGLMRREIALWVSETWQRRRDSALEALEERRTDPYTLAEEILDEVLAGSAR